MHITNFNERFDGRLHYNTGRRINNGFIRNNHNVLTISDRDTLHNRKIIKDFSGEKTLQEKIINSYKNFKPNMIVLGHADRVSINTLDYLKNVDKNIKLHNGFWTHYQNLGRIIQIIKKEYYIKLIL